jgi:hypothetical protein
VGTEELRGGRSAQKARGVLVRTQGGAFALTASRVLGVVELEGEGARLSTEGLGLHLRGPFQASGQEVLAIDPEGLFAYLAAAAEGS